MRSATAKDFVHSYIQAWNARDATQVGNHLTADGVYHDIPYQRQHGRSALVALLSESFNLDDSCYALEGEIQQGQRSLAFQYRAQSAATSTSWLGAEFIDLEDERAIRIRDFYQPLPTGVARTGPKYVKSGLDEHSVRQLKQKLHKLMHDERVYLSPDLTLPKLSKLAGCSVNHLSQVINAGFAMSYFDYLNHFRIEAAKRLLVAAEHRRESIINIAYQVGFNSNSAFYTAFKKACGQTPAQFRREKDTKSTSI